MNTHISTKIVIACTVAIFLLSGCSGQPVTFNSQKGTASYATTSEIVTARSCGFQLLLVIPIGINARQQRAYDRIVLLAKGGYIESIKVRESWGYRFVGTSYCTELEATVYPKI
jgi:uncharacterized lipoprotein YajG